MNANIIVVGILILGSLISSGAEISEPGDILYSVKTGFNEPIRNFLSLSIESKADWEASLAERRMWEAETLLLEKKLDEAEAETLISEIKSHLALSREYIEIILSEGNAATAARIASDVEARLNAHARILLAVGKTIGGNALADEIQTAVAEEGWGAAEEREKAESETASRPTAPKAAESRMSAAQEKISQVHGALGRRTSRMTPENRETATIKLTQAEEIFAEAQKEFAAGYFPESFLLFQSAHRRAEESKLLIDSTTILHVPLNLNRVPETLPSSENPPEVIQL